VKKEELRTDWILKIAEFKKSGKSQSAWCRDNSINLRTFNYWITKSKKASPQITNKSNWITITPAEANTIQKESTLTVKIGKAVLELNSDFDQSLFMNVVKVLNSLC
jgi:hypothetical protein